MNFDKSIIVVGDLGQLKAYRVSKVTGHDRQESMQVSHAQHRGTEKTSNVLEMITDIDYIEPHKRNRDLVSDQMGQFGGRLGTSTGEPHNTGIEHEKRMLKSISDDIREIIEKESPETWYLAFPKETCKQLGDMLGPQISKTLKKSLPSNLTKVAKNKLLSHFE